MILFILIFTVGLFPFYYNIMSVQPENITATVSKIKLDVSYTSWIASDGSEMKFENGTMKWYQHEGEYDDNYYFGKYEVYIGEEAIEFITEDLKEYGVTRDELEDIFDRNDEYSEDNFVVFDLVYDGITVDGETTVPTNPRIPWYGFILEDNTYLDVANMNTGTYYSFTKK